MPDVNVNIGGKAAGAIAAVGAAQSAIDGLTGKTVNLEINVRQNGGGGIGGATTEMEKLTAAHKEAGAAINGSASKTAEAEKTLRGHTAAMRNFGREATSAIAVQRRLGEESERASARSERATNRAANASKGFFADLKQGFRAGAASELSSIAAAHETAGTSFETSGLKAKAAATFLRKLADAGNESAASVRSVSAAASAPADTPGMAAARRVRELGWGTEQLAGANPEPAFINPYGERDGYGKTKSPLVSSAERDALDAANSTARKADEATQKPAKKLEETGKSADKAAGHVLSLGHVFGQLQNAGWQMSMIGGAMAGVTTEAMKLSNSTTGMGLNFAGMSKGIEMAEQSAARSHNLGLNGLDQELRQSARAMTNELAPAMKAGVQATKAFEEAKMGAQASTGSALTGFANQLTQSSPQLQSIMSSLGKTALNMGSDIVAGVAQAAPAFQQMANTVAQNGPEITEAAKDFSNIVAKGLQAGAAVTGFAEDRGNAFNNTLDKVLGATRDPSTGVLTGIGQWGASSRSGGAKPVAPGQFDPSKPFSGTLPDGTVGGGEPTAAAAARARTDLAPPRPFSDMAKAGGGALTTGYQPSKDAAWATGMTGAQVYAHQRAAAGVAPMGAPTWSGLGGDSTPNLGGHVAAGMASSLASSSGTSTAIENHVTKAVHQASPAAASGGSSLGAAMTGGMAQGVTSTQTVTDTVMIKHLKKLLDTAAGPSGIDAHSPSRKYDLLGRLIPQGVAQGVEADAGHASNAVTAMMNSKFSPDYAGSTGPTISIRKKSAKQQANADPAAAQDAAGPAAPSGQAMAYSSPLANANIDAHNARAADLAQGRADLHEIALANLGVPGHVDPRSMDVNPFVKAGQDTVAGIGTGVEQNSKAAVDPLWQVSQNMQNQYKKDNGINSPSAVYAGFSANIPAGAAVGISGNTGVAVGAVNGMSDAMQAAGGWLSDKGLMVGYAWAQNVITGANQVIKTADYQALGLPKLNQMALLSLASTNLLKAGSGAESYKMLGNSPGVVTLGSGVAAQPQEITVNAHFHLDDQITTISQKAMVNVLSQAGDSISLQASG